jgi:tRNA nucleotidyltransferase (CCA-adding enzyme)
VDGPIADRLRTAHSPEAQRILEITARLAIQHNWPVYLVGGWVRDGLLGIPNYDLDISVVGDAHALAHLIAQETGAEVEAHDRFDTATLHFPAESKVQSLKSNVEASESKIQNSKFKIHIDLVTARRETYETPGALPTVEAGTIQDDLARRDFTINAMAAELTPDGPGELVDPHGGLDDLNARLIRILHTGSFRDDPTRLIRAVKFAERLGFRIEQDMLELALQAIRDGALFTVSTDRVVRELLKVLEEPNAGAMLVRLEKLGILQAIHPALHWPYTPDRLDIAKDESITPGERRDAYLATIGAELAHAPDEAAQLARALNLTTPHVRLMDDAARLAQIWPQLGQPDMARSQVYNLLHPLDLNALEAYIRIRALSADTLPWERLHDYLTSARHIKPHITGEYLKQIGLSPGPAYKSLLQALLEAKLDGEVMTIADEERFVLEWLDKSGLPVDPQRSSS